MTDLEGVLGLVNTARAAMGKEPLQSLPRGRRGSSSDCVLARSLGMSFGNRSAWAVDGRHRQRRQAAVMLARAWQVHAGVLNRRSVQLPEGMRDFVSGFDAGDYPELVDPATRSEPGVPAGV